MFVDNTDLVNESTKMLDSEYVRWKDKNELIISGANQTNIM